MNSKMVAYFLGWIIRVEGLCMLLPILTAILYGESEAIEFIILMAICLILSELVVRKKPANDRFYTREGFICVGLGWVLLSVIGALPFVMSGAIPSFTDAFFEVVSGFTTTGATILTDVECLPKSLLMWRSFTHWLGGMGILMFILAVLPATGKNDMHIVRAESPGPTAGKFVAKAKHSAFILYGLYTAITFLEIILLLFGGMSLFDAVTLSFGTVGTGGFGVLNDSVGSYSVYTQTVITIFMILCGTNFSVFFLLYSGKIKEAFKSEEVKVYYGILFGSSILIAFNLLHSYHNNFIEAFRHAIFQVASVMTTTGYSTVDFNLWPSFSKMLMVIVMFIGACAGSTGGGIKVSRIIIMTKTVAKEFVTLIHPRNIKVLKFEGKAIEHSTLRSVNTYIMTYIGLFTLALLIVSLDGYDFETTFTAIVATINNIGPGLSVVGPMGNYSGFSMLSKYVMSFCMLAGRLELYPILLLFTARTWSNEM